MHKTKNNQKIIQNALSFIYLVYDPALMHDTKARITYIHSTMAKVATLRHLQQLFSGRQNHTLHIEQVKNIYSKYQKLISECIFS